MKKPSLSRSDALERRGLLSFQFLWRNHLFLGSFKILQLRNKSHGDKFSSLQVKGAPSQISFKRKWFLFSFLISSLKQTMYVSLSDTSTFPYTICFQAIFLNAYNQQP